MLDEPQQSLAGAAEFGELGEHQVDRFLHAAVRILLQTIGGLHIADRRRHDQLAAARLLVAGGKRTLAQQVELILVQAALQSEQQPIIALTRRINRLLIDEQGVDHPAHLDGLLPVMAVAGEARDLPGRHRSNLAEADFRHHAFETGADDGAGRRAAKIVIDDLDLAPA